MDQSQQPSAKSDSSVQGLFRLPELGGVHRTFAAGTAIFESNDPAERVYLVVKGQVRLYQVGPDESARLLDILGPGQWFGEAALAQFPVTGSRAVTGSQTEVIEVSAQALLDHLTGSIPAAVELLRELAEKLQAARDEASRFVFDDCNGRLIKTLVRFSESAAATRHADGVVLHVTHQQLAQAVGVARETVSLALTQLRQQQLLRTGRNRLLFNPDVLRSFDTTRRRTAVNVG
jgi:CRP-like cAMP-binding protein